MDSEGVVEKRLKMSEDIEPHCVHWIKRKNRFCKMPLLPNRNYCGGHKPVPETTDGSLSEIDRIPCPLDNKHFVYKHKLNKHLKICNARPKLIEEPYIVKNLNAGDCVNIEEYAKLTLKELEDAEFYEIIEKVKRIYKSYVADKIEQLEVRHKLLDDELANEEYGKESRKHLLQISALLGILAEEDQIKAHTSFIEFGAGKGQLAFYLAQLLQMHEDSQVVLIDRMSMRHKKDNKVKNRDLVKRIRADIADLYMPGLDVLKRTKRNVAFSKHLCGAATDLTLRCIAQTEKAENKCSLENQTEFIMIALCCHHRCDWGSFVGKEFMLAQGINVRQFTLITKMVSWAICGTGLSRERRRELENKTDLVESQPDITRTQRLSLAERESIGLMCKRILDYARCEYLRQHGYEATLKYYTTKDVTPDNVCLLAHKIPIS